MVQQGHERLLELRPQLQDELVVGLDGEGRRDEADMQRAAERHQHVDGAPVVQAHDGVDALGELGADWNTDTARRVKNKMEQHLAKSSVSERESVFFPTSREEVVEKEKEEEEEAVF